MFAGHLKRFNSASEIMIPSDLVFVYDEITQTLSVDTLSQARTFIGGGDVNSQVLLYTSQSSVVDVYDISENSWTSNFMNYSKVTHTSISSGNKVYVAGGISGSTTLNYFEIYDTTVGIDELNDQDKGSLFPNPASHEIFLKIPSDYLGSEFFITNIFGVQLFKANAGFGMETIDISNLSMGLYFVYFENNRSTPLKFIKQ